MGQSKAEVLEPLVVAFYCTGHGLGHATRAIEICRHLVDAGHSVIMVTGAPGSVFLREIPSVRFSFRKCVLDCGSRQLDAFSVDMKGSLEQYYATAVKHRDTLLETEQAWLQASRVDVVVSDTVPLACAAAHAVGVPAVVVTNFSWDFIYSEYLTSVGSEFRKMVWQIAEDFAQADLLLRLPGYCPMPAFRAVQDVPLVVRHARRPASEVREALGVGPEVRTVVFIYGGQPPGNWNLRADFLPPGWLCLVCAGGKPSDKPLPPNFLLAPADAYTPDLIAASECVLGKIGYGTMSECLAHGRPLVFVRRDHFNEEPFLRKVLERHNLAVEIKRRDFLQGNWGPFLERALTLTSTFMGPTNGAEVVAATLAAVARGSQASGGGGRGGGQLHRSGSVRLRDTIVWGYCMARHSARGEVDIPDWYTDSNSSSILAGGSPRSRQPGASQQVVEGTPSTAPVLQDWEVIAGAQQLEQCPDTAAFLEVLAHLDDPPPPGAPEMPEARAARGLFRWEDEVYVARAPGRLDVMGGIADYSGALVLQLPLAEACHAAVQRHPPHKQRLWNHMRARQAGADASATGSKPALRVVSFHGDATNRGPAYDLDLAELERGGQPIPYEEARSYFTSDPAHSWAAYVCGAVLVLMRECGARFPDGISILISSAVPEGKGVSSSAAVEVAVMSALAAAHNIPLDGRKLALLCQQVENRVVGAPCGVMDQMASALGQEGRLLALLCQPAQLQAAVAIPPNIRFWGLDSGIRHSVGGNDYSSVRAAAFMGLRILTAKAAEQKLRCISPPQPSGPAIVNGVDAAGPLAGGYLARLAPSIFAEQHEHHLPAYMTGREFEQQYGSHCDPATSLAPDARYPVRAATAHPVAEQFRVATFRALLQSRPLGPEALATLGELMYQAHASYSKCGLGSEGTDLMVALVREEAARAAERGQEPALYGAKITGGGSGGTVCIMGSADARAEEALQRVIQRYQEATRHAPHVFAGSSMGAAAFGFLHLRRRLRS